MLQDGTMLVKLLRTKWLTSTCQLAYLGWKFSWITHCNGDAYNYLNLLKLWYDVSKDKSFDASQKN